MPIFFPDALQEFKVETSGLAANRGNASAVAVVTKSGTNNFHGDVFEFFRNDAVNGHPYFAITPSTLKRNQYGGTLGGAIIKNKLFFFGGFQGTNTRSDAASSQSFVPTDDMLSGDWRAYAACGNSVTRAVVRQGSSIQPFRGSGEVHRQQGSRRIESDAHFLRTSNDGHSPQAG